MLFRSRYLAPQDAATAQVKYDCWIEATEDGRSDDADACKAAFESAMAALESQANSALTDIDYTTPAPAMAAATPSQTQFIVLFDFDSVSSEEHTSELQSLLRRSYAVSSLT